MSVGTTAIEISDETDQLAGAPRTDKPAATLRGSARGLEIVVDAPSGLDAIVAAATARLDEAPTFFKGSDVRIRVEDGPLPAGSLGKLEELALRFDLRLIEIAAAKKSKPVEDAVPQPTALALGSSPWDDVPTTQGAAYRSTSNEFEDVPTQLLPAPPNGVVMATAMVLAPALGTVSLEDALVSVRGGLSWVSPPTGPQPEPAPKIDVVDDKPAPAPEIEIDPETRIVVGPVRSGVILDHRGHVIVFGDVNPGAEIRAAGNIVVLGRLRGLAHAGIGANVGFIVALHLQPQQLRIGRMVARASDEAVAAIPEIAYVTNGSIVVERYTGKLPAGLAASLT